MFVCSDHVIWANQEGILAASLFRSPDVRAILREQGFNWVSSLYPPHATPRPMEEPGAEVYDSIVQAQAAAQPFIYPDGLVEVPMSPISYIGAFRTGRWRLEWFLKAIRLGVEWAIDRRAVYDFLGHPLCLYVTDPDFRAIALICDLVRKAGDRAAIVGLDSIARRTRLRMARRWPGYRRESSGKVIREKWLVSISRPVSALGGPGTLPTRCMKALRSLTACCSSGS
jgi:hypothetical protein